MNWQEVFTDLVKFFGVPGALFAVALYGIYKGWFVTRREYDRLLHENLADETQWQSRYAELKAEKDMWRDMALKGARVAEQAANTAKVAAEKLPPAGG